MKNKYKINQTVRVIINNELLIVKDFECFDDVILYYFDSKTAYSENDLTEVTEKEISFRLIGGLDKMFKSGFFKDMYGNPIFLE